MFPMDKKVLFLSVFALLLLATVPTAEETHNSVISSSNTDFFAKAYTERNPIVITSDADFSSQGFPGNGSESNPYLLEGYNITSDDVCIDISGTSAHYKINGCLISAPVFSSNQGILIDSAPNGTVESCIIEKHQYGLRIASSEDCVVKSNTVRDNSEGLSFYDCDNFLISNNTAFNDEISLYLTSSYHCVISNNTLKDSTKGGYISGVYLNVIDNIVKNNSEYGLFTASEYSTVAENEIMQNPTGIYFYSGQGLNISFNQIYDNTEYGFYGYEYDLRDSILANNTFSDNKYGVYLSRVIVFANPPENFTFVNNTLINNGLYLGNRADSNWITDVTGTTVNEKPLGYFTDLNDSIIDGTQYGQVILINCSYTDVIGGIFDNVTLGVTAISSNNCTFMDISSLNNSAVGFRLINSDDCHIINNTASNNLNYGFILDNSHNCSLTNNTALDNSQSGFYISSSHYLEIYNTSAVDNSNHGFYLDNSDFCNLTRNIAQSNNETGFYEYRCSVPEYHENEANENGYDGFNFEDTDNGTLVNNIAKSNSRNGYSFTSSDTYTLTNNTAESNANNGFFVRDSYYHYLDFNDGCANFIGFNLDSSVNCSLQNNTAISNSLHGFNLHSSDNSTFIKNNATQNILIGISLTNSSSCTMYQNTVIHNNIGIQVDIDSESNLFYLNRFGYNSLFNGLDESYSTDWDNTTQGNCWSDYDGSGHYLVDGSPGNIDNHPCILDLYVPTLNQPQDISYELGETGNSILWIAYDLHLDSYVVHRNNTLIDSNTTDGTNITINVDGLDIGSYNYTITVNDTMGKVSVDTVFVEVFDTIPPELDHPEDIDYELGSTDNVLTWNLTDFRPDSYELYQNGSLIEEGFWSGGDIQFIIDGLPVGTYIFTLVANDTTGNNASDSVIVSVVDTISPNLDSSSDIQYELGSMENSITWTVSDLDPFSYEVYVDGSLMENSSWDGSQIDYNVDGFAVGSYNVMLIIYDSSGNHAIDNVAVNVIDTTIPTIDSTPDFQYEVASTGNSISWIVSDLDAYLYEIHCNGVLIQSESWDGSNIEYNADGMSVGSHNITLIIFDSSGNRASDSVIVNVTDTITPTISSPEDVTYEAGTNTHSISWNVTDASTLHYVLLRNGTELYDGTMNDSKIIVDIDSLALGTYNFTLIVTDEGGNTANDSVLVHVLLPSSISTTTTVSTQEGWNPMIIGLVAGIGIAGFALVVFLFIVPKIRNRERL
ncbi:MAG: hypothetical protein GF411_03735 [Candidatus Lokiarchaeota archaeon]|nr:hypothetical protein [Candidatus Lokiarchaeota archaeon]